MRTALVLLALSSTALAQQVDLAEYADEETFEFVSVDDGGAFFAKFRETGLWKLYSDKALWDSAMKMMTDMAEMGAPGAPGSAETLKKMRDLFTVFLGNLDETAAALGSFQAVVNMNPEGMMTGEGTEFVYAFDFSKSPEVAGKWFDALAGMSKEGEGLKVSERDGWRILDNDGTVTFALKGSLFLFGGNTDPVLFLSKKAAKNLKSTPLYQHARAAVEATPSDAFVYVNFQAFMESMSDSPAGPQMGAVMGMFGLGQYKYMAASAHGEGNDLVSKWYLCTDATKSAPKAEELRSKKVEELLAMPGVIEVEESGLNVEECVRLYRKLLEGIMGAAAGAGQPMPFDFSALPWEQIAAVAGRSSDLIVTDAGGMTVLSRSPLGVSAAVTKFMQGGMMAGMMIRAMMQAQQRAGSGNQEPKLLATVRATEGLIAQVKTGIDLFKLEHGRYPEKLSDLVERPAYIDENEWPVDGYLDDKDALKDAWGNEFQYSVLEEGDGVVIVSFGADGVEGGDGADADISSNRARR